MKITGTIAKTDNYNIKLDKKIRLGLKWRPNWEDLFEERIRG
jgi:hypothetical protein